MKSAQGHATSMYFLHWSAHHLDGLHCLSCACQCGPFLGWMARRMLLPFFSYQNWHSRILPIDYFWKVILLLRLPPKFPCDWTYHMYPCRTLLQNPIPVCRIVFSTSWGRREWQSCSILQGPFSWQRLIEGKSEGSYSVPLVVRQIYRRGDLKVFALRVSSHVFTC